MASTGRQQVTEMMASGGPSRYLRTVLALLAVAMVALGINPRYRDDWLLENILTAIGVIALLWVYRRWRLSDASCTLLAIFALLHSLGSHYTYAEVPYDTWLRAVFGTDLQQLFGIERNHYDRLVHFLFGLLWLHPLREIILRATPVDRLTSYLYPVALLAMVSHCYELAEWGAAELLGGDLGMAFLGAQGDVWDAHKDMGLAFAGALVAAAAEWVWARRRDTAGNTLHDSWSRG